MSESVVEHLGTDDVIAVYLYRVDERDGYFYGTIRQVGTKPAVDLIGVATRYTGDQIRHGETLSEFRENVNRLAVDVCWFDRPISTDGSIAEFLYRATWSEDRNLYAATKQEKEFTDHDLIGVVVRPPQQTVESTKWGRSEFEENVADVAETTVWFKESASPTPRLLNTDAE